MSAPWSSTSARPHRVARHTPFGLAWLAWLVRLVWLAAILILAGPCAHAQPRLEQMTWTELHERLAKGDALALVPIGGTEQSGPHIALGKHNARALALADEIAQRLGNAVVAPVVSYVPEGAISPPTAHMRFAGTISIPVSAFESLLEGSARSLCQHGFAGVYFLGDHGGYQRSLDNAAQAVRAEMAAKGCQVAAVRAYYDATQTTYVKALQTRGFTQTQIGTHAGLADTSLSMALTPELVRKDRLQPAAKAGSAAGVYGDPSLASPELGKLGEQAILDATLASIQALRHAFQSCFGHADCRP